MQRFIPVGINRAQNFPPVVPLLVCHATTVLLAFSVCPCFAELSPPPRPHFGPSSSILPTTWVLFTRYYINRCVSSFHVISTLVASPIDPFLPAFMTGYSAELLRIQPRRYTRLNPAISGLRATKVEFDGAGGPVSPSKATRSTKQPRLLNLDQILR